MLPLAPIRAIFLLIIQTPSIFKAAIIRTKYPDGGEHLKKYIPLE